MTGVTPNRGSTGGGTLVTITGSDFTDAIEVTFGGRAAESFAVVNNGTIQAQTPVGTIGAAQVAVASSSGISSIVRVNKAFGPPLLLTVWPVRG